MTDELRDTLKAGLFKTIADIAVLKIKSQSQNCLLIWSELERAQLALEDAQAELMPDPPLE
jgi:hypothetical protein